MSGLAILIFDSKEVNMFNHADSEPDIWGSYLIEDLQEVMKIIINKFQNFTEEDVLRCLKDMFTDLKIVDQDSKPPTKSEIEKLKKYSGIDLSTVKGEVKWDDLLGECPQSFKLILESGYIYDDEYCETDYEYIIDFNKNEFSLNGKLIGKIDCLDSEWVDKFN
jgi:hypothetical protein